MKIEKIPSVFNDENLKERINQLIDKVDELEKSLKKQKARGFFDVMETNEYSDGLHHDTNTVEFP